MIRRRKRPKMNVRPPTVVRSPGHMAWVRGHECIMALHPERVAHRCGGRMEAHHVYAPGDAKGRKPPDSQTVPVCSEAHEIIGRILGKESAERMLKVDLLAIAAELWRRSPHRIAWERKMRELENA